MKKLVPNENVNGGSQDLIVKRTVWIFGLTWLGLLNYIILQWIFVRLAEEIETDASHVRWFVQFPVVPLTGWGALNNFKESK